MALEDLRKCICMPSEDLVAREIEGELIIIPLVAGIGSADDELYTLNETGKAIWHRLDGEKTLEQVVAELQNDFSTIKDEIEADVLGFADEMIKMGILVVKE